MDKNLSLESVDLILKATLQDDGTMRWKASVSDTSPDRKEEQTSLALFQSWIDYSNGDKRTTFLPEPRKPFLGISHYPSLDGKGEAGSTDLIYTDGTYCKAKGSFYPTELGKKLFNALREEQDKIAKNEPVENPIRISAAWFDIQHKHGDFVFTRRSITDKCPMCSQGIGNKVYLEGQLDHFAATRVPVQPRTLLQLEEKSDMEIKTRLDDASTIIGEEQAKKLEEETNHLMANKSEVMVIKSEEDKQPETKEVTKDIVEQAECKKKDIDNTITVRRARKMKKPDKKVIDGVEYTYDKENDQYVDEDGLVYGFDEETKSYVPAEEEDIKIKPVKKAFTKKVPAKKAIEPEVEEEEMESEEMDEEELKKPVAKKAFSKKAPAKKVVEVEPEDEEELEFEEIDEDEEEVKPKKAFISYLESKSLVEENKSQIEDNTSAWDIFKASFEIVMENREIDDSSKLFNLKAMVAEFDTEVKGIKENVADLYLGHPLYKAEVPVSSKKQEEDEPEIFEEELAKAEKPKMKKSTATLKLKSQVDEILESEDMDRKVLETKLNEVLTSYARELKSEVDSKYPVNQVVNGSEVQLAVEKMLNPLMEQVNLLTAKLNEQQEAIAKSMATEKPQVIQPVQKSLTINAPKQIQNSGGSPLSSMIRKSVGL